MVRNGFWLWYEMVNYGTKWLWCKIHMVRNCNFVVRNGKIWYEMVMVQNSYGTKWFLVMVRNCNFVVRNGKLWYEMAMVRNGYGTKWLASVFGIRSNRHLVISTPIYIVKSALTQIGTCHGQFGTSVKNNFVIIKYLYIKKKKNSWIIS